MIKNKLYTFLFVFLSLVILSYSNLYAQTEKPVSVDIWNGKAMIEQGDVKVKYYSHPLRLMIKNEGQTVLKSAKQPFLAAIDGENNYVFSGTNKIHRLYKGFRAELKGPAGQRAYFEVTMGSGGGVQIEIIPFKDTKGITVNLRQSSDEHYYGLGDAWLTTHVDLKGSKVELWNEPGTPDEGSWVPFFMSTAGYGLFIDNSYRGTIDFGKTDKDVTSIHFEAPSLTMHVWTGKSMKDILPQYLSFTGYSPVPPKWSFLPQKWRDEGTWKEVFEDVRLMKKHNMPLGAVWIDRPWMLGPKGNNDYIFDKKRYPNPKKHIKKLNEMGIHVLVWGADFLTKDSKYFEEGLINHYFVNGYGKSNDVPELYKKHFYIDFANPEAREWFKGIIKNVIKMGVDGFKVDRGQLYPVHITPPSGRDPKAMHNYHAYLMIKTYAKALQEVLGNDYQLTPRAGWAGTQQWTMKWPGDMASDFSHDAGLPAVVRAQMSAGLTGFALWGSDIGGFGSQVTKELFIRWLEFGVFSPLMETVGKGNHKDAPFSWDEETVKVYKFYAQLRKNMVPYLMDMARKAHKTGAPIARHLAWNWPNDSKVHSLDYEYMFGDALLVAPVVEKDARSRKVYLPEGKWVDFWNRDRIIEGPTTITVKVPLWKIPLFIRKGSHYTFEIPDVEWPGK